MEYSDIEDEFYDCESESEENKIELLDRVISGAFSLFIDDHIPAYIVS